MAITDIYNAINEHGTSFGELVKQAESNKELMAKVRKGKDLNASEEQKAKENLPGKQEGEKSASLIVKIADFIEENDITVNDLLEAAE